MKITNNLTKYCEFKSVEKGSLFVHTNKETYIKIEPVYITNADLPLTTRFNAVEVGTGRETWVNEDEPVVKVNEIILK